MLNLFKKYLNLFKILVTLHKQILISILVVVIFIQTIPEISIKTWSFSILLSHLVSLSLRL